GDAAENAEMLRRLLEGEPGARREAALWNAAVALTVAGLAAHEGEGYERAAEAIDSGKARETLDRLREASRAGAGARPS
ncbi:MAG TPA: anthranilate phosphoribosyltransferase, partial [Anaeromyxobacter sp.]